MTTQIEIPDEHCSETPRLIVLPRRRSRMRGLVTTVLFLIAFAIVGAVGRQLTKERWHTLYSHAQPGDALLLAVECPEGWEADGNPLLRTQKSNSIWIHPKPTVGLLHWWQEHMLHEVFHDHTIVLTVMEDDRPASKAENEVMFLTIKSVDLSPTTTLTRHRLGPEIDIRNDMAPMPGFQANFSPTSISTFIFLDETPTNNAVSIIIFSNEFGESYRYAERIRKEIIQRLKVVKR